MKYNTGQEGRDRAQCRLLWGQAMIDYQLLTKLVIEALRVDLPCPPKTDPVEMLDRGPTKGAQSSQLVPERLAATD